MNKKVILITIDCGRQDFIYGDEVKTPNIDQLREDSVTFTEAFCQTNNTIPSMISIFTSLYLSDHKVCDHYFPLKDLPLHHLPKFLREKGWRTVGFCGVGIVSEFFGKLFKTNTVKTYILWLKGNIIKRAINMVRKYLPSLFKKLSNERACYFSRPNADVIVEDAINYLNNVKPDKDVFLWLHFFDAHFPYQVPDEYLSLYTIKMDQSTERKLAKKYFDMGKFISLNTKEKQDFKMFPLKYRATLSYIDSAIGKLIKYLKSKEIYDDSMCILTSDHGESLVEHDVYYGHVNLFDASTKVPLIIKFPGNNHSGTECSDMVEHVDIYPTILCQYGDNLDNGVKIRGINLLDILNNKKEVVNRFIISEDFCNVQRSIRDRDWQLIDAIPPGHWVSRADKDLGNKLNANGDQLLRREDANYKNYINIFPEEAGRLRKKLDATLIKTK
jgi:arylsulfatase A-like enzyme